MITSKAQLSYLQKSRVQTVTPPRPELRDQSIVIGGPLDITVCPTQADANRVVAGACRLLNRYPLLIDTNDFPNKLRNKSLFLGFCTLLKITSLI